MAEHFAKPVDSAGRIALRVKTRKRRRQVSPDADVCGRRPFLSYCFGRVSEQNARSVQKPIKYQTRDVMCVYMYIFFLPRPRYFATICHRGRDLRTSFSPSTAPRVINFGTDPFKWNIVFRHARTPMTPYGERRETNDNRKKKSIWSDQL